jgi:membrane protein DedA with SNARE-associated domain
VVLSSSINPKQIINPDCGYISVVGILNIIPFIYGMDYIAIFLLTFISAILIIVPVPYFPVLIAAVLVTNLDPNLIALYGALGAVTAKSIIYLISYYGANASRLKRNFNPHDYPETFRIIRKYGWLVIFIASVTPIPDNIIFIPLGMYKYNPLKFIATTFVAKIILNETVVWGTAFIGKPIVGNLSEINIDMFTLIITVSLSIVLFGALFFLFLKVKWAVFLEKFFLKIKLLRGNKDNP